MGLRNKLSNAKESVKGSLSKVAADDSVDQLDARKQRARQQARKEEKQEMREDAIEEAREKGRRKARREKQSVFEKLSDAASSLSEQAESVEVGDEQDLMQGMDVGSGMPATDSAFGGGIQEDLDAMDADREVGDPFDYDASNFESSKTESERFDPFGSEQQDLESMGFYADADDEEGLF